MGTSGTNAPNSPTNCALRYAAPWTLPLRCVRRNELVLSHVSSSPNVFRLRMRAHHRCSEAVNGSRQRSAWAKEVTWRPDERAAEANLVSGGGRTGASEANLVAKAGRAGGAEANLVAQTGRTGGRRGQKGPTGAGERVKLGVKGQSRAQRGFGGGQKGRGEGGRGGPWCHRRVG